MWGRLRNFLGSATDSLRTAYNGRDRLPDAGRRVRTQLRELARRLSQRGQDAANPG